MVLKLQPFHKKGNICMEDNIITVANYFNKKYFYMYANGLDFKYTPKIQSGDSVLRLIRTSCIYPTYDYLHDFVGLHIDIKPRSEFTKSELINFIKKSIEENIPVGIFLDAYCIPWYNKFYQKVHMPHSFLVVDVNDKEKYLSCIDGFLSEKSVNLPFENLFIYTSVMTFKPILPKKNTSFNNIISQIINGLNDSGKLDNCDSIRLFSQDVQKIIFTEEEKTIYKDLDDSQFMFGLKSIEYGRKNIADMLYYISTQFPAYSENLISIQSKLNSISEQWKLVIVFFIKGFYSNQTSYYMNKAAELLLNIANNEENVAQSLLSLI